MKRILISTILMLTVVLGLGSVSFANENNNTGINVDKYIEEQLGKMKVDDIQSYIDEEDMLKKVDLKTYMKEVMTGKKNILDLFDKEGIKMFLFKELKSSLKIFAIILVLALLSSILKSLDNSFSSGAITQITTYVVFISMVSLTLVGFKDVLNICYTTIDTMINLMQIVIPILIAFLVVMGFPITSTALNPIFLGGITFINIIFKNFLFASIAVAFSVLVINNLSKNIKLKKFSSFIKQINIVTIGAMFTIYLALVSIQGLYVTTFDKFTVKTAKFAVGNFIPIVGGFVSDSVELLLSSSQLIKSVFGVVGLIILIGICAIPVIKIISIILVYKVSAIAIEPIGEDGICNFLNEIGNLMTIMLASMIAITIMFFVTIAILTSIGTVSGI